MDALRAPSGPHDNRDADLSADEASKPTLFRRITRLLPPLVAIALISLAAYVLRRELENVTLAEVLHAFSAIAPGRVGIALLFTLLSFAAYALYELAAMRYIGRKLPLVTVIGTGGIANTLANGLGFSLLTTAAVRFRVYSGLGLSTAEILLIMAISSTSFGLGMSFVAGLGLLTAPEIFAGMVGLGAAETRLAGFALITPATAYLTFCAFGRGRTVDIRAWRLRIPDLRTAVMQIGGGVLDVTAASGALYMLMPEGMALPFPVFVSLTAVAISLGVASTVPGGLGVIESIILIALPDAPTEGVVGGLLAFRLTYYLLPLTIAGIAVAAVSSRRLATAPRGLAASLRVPVRSVTPLIIAATAVLAGGLLLVSSLTPPISGRLAIPEVLLPLALVETAAIAAGLISIGLLLFARGLLRRQASSWRAAAALLAAGVAAAILSGPKYAETVFLLAALALTVVTGPMFDRPGRLTPISFGTRWVGAAISIYAIAVSLGLIAYRHVDPTLDLVTAFAADGGAARALRVGIVVSLFGFALLVWRLTATPRAGFGTIGKIPADLPGLIAKTPDPLAQLAYLGDKVFLFTRAREAAIMFRPFRRDWIAFGDPLGAREALGEAIWTFRDAAERAGRRSVFFGTRPEHRSLYIDAGLSLIPIGEEAVVDIIDNRLDAGPSRSGDGSVEVVISPAPTAAQIERLRPVSDEWLEMTGGIERRFLAGAFDPGFLARSGLAILNVDGRAAAFASFLLGGAAHTEAAIDLMRWRRGTTAADRDLLLGRLAEHLRGRGVVHLILGTAPPLNTDSGPLAPTWEKVAPALFGRRAGDHDIGQVRERLDRFRPDWRPRHIALPGDLHLAGILSDCAALAMAEAPDRPADSAAS